MTHTAAAETSTIVPNDIEGSLRAACARIAPVWPLENFVAVNPYLGLADHRFGEAAERLASTVGARSTMPAEFYLDAIECGRISKEDLAVALAASGSTPANDVGTFLELVRRTDGEAEATRARVPTVADVAAAVTGQAWGRLATDSVSAWAAAYFDRGQAMWRSVDGDIGLFAAWKDEAEIDRTPEVMGLAGFRAVMRSLPEDPLDAAALVLSELGLPAEGLELYLHRLLLRVGGWAACAARVVWDSQLRDEDDDTLVQFLAVLLCWELGIARSLSGGEVAASWSQARETLRSLGDRPALRASLAQLVVLQDAFDRSEQRCLIEKFASRPTARPGNDLRPRAQAVFCIDVRSEVYRRNLEAVAEDVRTIGFAGFFGFPIEYIPIAHEQGEAQCPVLLTPSFTVAETVPDLARHEEAVAARRLEHHVRRSWKSFKMGAISCFSFVGPVGLLYLPKMFSDTFGWSRPVQRPEDEGLPSSVKNQKGPSLSAPLPGMAGVGIALSDRLQLAEGALRAMSLADGFAPLVMIVGHGASTVNNPYDTGLDCGACGGHTGEANSRVAVAILNDAEVRQGLAGRGIAVPEDTWFLAGQHNTTTDEVALFDSAGVPTSHADLVADLRRDLAEASHRARVERSGRLGIAAGPSADAAVLRRSTDWAQVRPEWGLAGCHAFVVAPRSRTQDLDLGGRAFLHSYDWRQDDGFGVLELVMTAPMVVASWISLQYFASTVENRLFGSGNKTLHNVVGKLGVLEGNSGDLRVGLPWQSLHDGDRLQHEPLRLSVIIEAPIDAMNGVLAAHPPVQDLCDNEWLYLMAMDDAGRITHRYASGLMWEQVGV